MANEKIIDNILASYSAKRNQREKDIADNYKKLIDRCPEFAKVRAEYAKVMAESFRMRMNGNKSDLDKAHKDYSDALKKCYKKAGMSTG